MDHPEHVKLHLNYAKGPMVDEEALIGGEGPWAIPVPDKPSHYTIDNLLFGTIGIGLYDVVRCADIGTEWGDREVVELVEGYPCWRGITLAPEKVEEFVEDLRQEFTPEQVQLEGGIGSLMMQCEPAAAESLMAFLDTTDYIEVYALEPVNIDDS